MDIVKISKERYDELINAELELDAVEYELQEITRQRNELLQVLEEVSREFGLLRFTIPKKIKQVLNECIENSK